MPPFSVAGSGFLVSSTAAKQRAPARLGLALRQILVTPRAGFETASALAAEREREGVRPAAGWTPYVLALLAGAAGMALWLKVGGLVGLRDVPVSEFRWPNLIASLVVGGLLGLAGLALWGRAGPFVLDVLHGEGLSRTCRVVWGTSGLPQATGVLLLVPLDLAIVGPQIFATENLGNPSATAWAAFSIALAMSLAVWSVFLFVRGTEVTASLPAPRAVAAGIGALGCLAAPAALFFVAISQIAGRLT